MNETESKWILSPDLQTEVRMKCWALFTWRPKDESMDDRNRLGGLGAFPSEPRIKASWAEGVPLCVA